MAAPVPPRGGSRIKQERQRRSLLVLAAVILLVGAIVAVATREAATTTATAPRRAARTTEPDGGRRRATAPPTTTREAAPALRRLGEPGVVGPPVGRRRSTGLLTFRGNPTRTYYGTGPVPTDPEVLWTLSRRERRDVRRVDASSGEATTWCGTGWTGQPSVWEQRRPHLGGVRRLRQGRALPRRRHRRATSSRRSPPATSSRARSPSTPTASRSLYSGSRDNYYHVHRRSTGREPMRAVDAVGRRGQPDDVEQRLGRLGPGHRRLPLRGRREQPVPHREAQPGVRAPTARSPSTPELVFNAPGWDDELLAAIGDQDVSIENSVAISGNTVYFANSGGLVQGWDISGLAEGADAARGRSASGPATTPTPRSSSTTRACSTSASEYERGNEPARRRSAS